MRNWETKPIPMPPFGPVMRIEPAGEFIVVVSATGNRWLYRIKSRDVQDGYRRPVLGKRRSCQLIQTLTQFQAQVLEDKPHTADLMELLASTGISETNHKPAAADCSILVSCHVI